MAYGTVKVDNITFTNGGIDQTVTVSGIVQSISGNITATGTIQGQTIIGTSTVSGATVTGDVGVFTTVTGGSAGFTTVTGTTVTGTTANFVNGTFSTQVSGTTVRGTTVSGTTVTGAIGQFTTLTGGTAGFTTVTGTTVTGTTANFQSGVFTTQISGATVTGNVGSFSTITGGTVTLTSGVFGTGTAAAPSIAFTGDSNTGIYSPGADQVAVATNGAGKVFVSSNGNLGVGTINATNAAGKIHSRADGNEPKSLLVLQNRDTGSDAGGAINFVNGGVDFSDVRYSYIRGIVSGAGQNGNHLVFGTNANGQAPSERLRITSAGLVGIGTSSPQALLHLSSSVITESFYTATGTGGRTWRIGTGDNASGLSGALRFYDETGAATRLLIDSSGRVGIGTTSPGNTLDISPDSAGAALRIRGGTGGTSIVQFTDNTASAQWGTIATTSGSVDLTHSSVVRFLTASSERLRITSAGLVGIGTSSPGALLHVGGNTDNNVQAILAQGNDSNFRLVSINKSAANISGSEVARFGIRYAIGASDSSGIQFFRGNTAAEGSVGLYTGGTTRLYVQGTTGNVGIGTTSPVATLDVRGNASIGAHDAATVGVELGQGATGDRDAYIDFIGDTTYTDYGLRLIRAGSANGGAYIYNRGTGALTFQGVESAPFVFVHGISSERARIDSSGRLLVGTSTSASNGQAQYARLQVEGNTFAVSQGIVAIRRASSSLGLTTGTPIGQIDFTDNAGEPYARIEVIADGVTGSSDYPGRLVFSTTADGASSPTERMRITNTGRVTEFATNDNCLLLASNNGAGTTYALIYGTHTATAVNTGTVSFAVFTNGDVQNTNNSYGAYSDLKLKENIVDAASQWSDIKALQVRKYNFKEETGQQTHTQIGLIAQEVELVSPGLVSEAFDRDEEGAELETTTKSINYSVLYMKAVKALQEAMERIEALEQRLNDAGIN